MGRHCHTRPGPEDVDDGQDGILEEGDSGRRKGGTPGGGREPAAPMSPTPQPGPLGDEPEDAADPATPPTETIR